jgi:hypothetical protein
VFFDVYFQRFANGDAEPAGGELMRQVPDPFIARKSPSITSRSSSSATAQPTSTWSATTWWRTTFPLVRFHGEPQRFGEAPFECVT